VIRRRGRRSWPPRDIEAALDHVADAIDVPKARTLVGLAGSVTTVAAIALGGRRV